MHLMGPGSMKILVGSWEGQEGCMPATERTHLLYFQELGKCLLNQAVKNLHSKVKILHILSVFVQSRNTFAQSLCINSSSLSICQKVHISTHCSTTYKWSAIPPTTFNFFIYLFSLHFWIPLLRWQDTTICLSKFLFCCGSAKSSSS